MLSNYKNIKIGQRVYWRCQDFDGSQNGECIITDVCSDHAIATPIEFKGALWVDDDTLKNFQFA